MKKSVVALALLLSLTAPEARESKAYSTPEPSTDLERCLVQVGVMTYAAMSIMPVGETDPAFREMVDTLYFRFKAHCAAVITSAYPADRVASDEDQFKYHKWEGVGHCQLALGTSAPFGKRITQFLVITEEIRGSWCRDFESPR